MLKKLTLLLFLLIVTSCVDKSEEHPIYGDWNVRYLYVNGEDFVGYYDNDVVYFSKLATFTKNGQLIVFLDDENKKVIKADFELTTNLDSIKFKSGLKNLNGTFKVNLSDDKGSVVMKLQSDNGEMHFKRINASINM